MPRIRPAHVQSASPAASNGGKKTVAQILQQARGAMLSGTAALAGQSSAAATAAPTMTTVSGTVRRGTVRSGGRRRQPFGGGRHSHDEATLAAELGTSAPIGPAVIELLSLAYRADVPALLIGSHGLGKSEITAAAAAALGIECISRDLSLMEPPDLVGLPKVDAAAESTKFLPPEFLPRESGRGGFLLIEEINRAPRYMQSCCLELLTSRRLNSYVLPRGWLPVACINPKNENYAVDLLDAALMSRFMQITVCASVESWAAWARANDIHPKVVEYVETVPNSLDDSHGGSNPRSWAYASRTLKAAGAELLERSPDTLVTALNGLIGPVHTTALLRLILGTELALKPADVIKDWRTSQAVMNRWKQLGRLDLLAASMRAMLQWLRPEGIAEELKADKRSAFVVRLFFSNLPGDLMEQACGCLLELGYAHLIPAKAEGQPQK